MGGRGANVSGRAREGGSNVIVLVMGLTGNNIGLIMGREVESTRVGVSNRMIFFGKTTFCFFFARNIFRSFLRLNAPATNLGRFVDSMWDSSPSSSNN